MARPLLLTATFLALMSCTSAVVLNTTRKDPDFASRTCSGAVDGSFCYPLNKTMYVSCASGQGKLVPCATGKVYDYVQRKCVAAGPTAKPCPSFNCPAPGSYRPGAGSISNFTGQFGTVGSFNITFDKEGTTYGFCPISGHCLSGMVFGVKVKGKVPAGEQPTTVVVEFEETLTNGQNFPSRLKDVQLRIGDILNVWWDEPIHVLAFYDPSKGVVPTNPYPPQPVYKCPTWDYSKGQSTIKGETVLVNSGPAGNYTFTATKPETFWFVCTVPNHCRMGMIFKVTVQAAPAGYKPKQTTINWTMGQYDLFPDLTLSTGDSLFFTWGGQGNFHGVSRLNKVASW